jgi:hypothetical protein
MRAGNSASASAVTWMAGEEPGLEARGFHSPVGSVWASGMHAAIVETDPGTAEVKVLKHAVMHDCGNMVNPMVVEGQIHGGVAQGVAGALYERYVLTLAALVLPAGSLSDVMGSSAQILKQCRLPDAGLAPEDQGAAAARPDVGQQLAKRRPLPLTTPQEPRRRRCHRPP